MLKEGEFRTLGDNITVYVREREEEGQLAGLIVHDDREADKSVTLVAERGILIAGEAAPRVVMEKGSRQERDLDSGQVSILYFDRHTIDLGSLRSNAQRASETGTSCIWATCSIPLNQSPIRTTSANT